ncbi:hypothetical protein NHP190012_13660 [Helicobacter sp. NHP19-012]|uniref:Uncharacterized protein n=1 Tax=Helicobacter gastrofelis TaxID=2849642 RepID=A0ABN6IAK6_9HELI|nr:hypothetical protein NHP190012_13660 [Helicobacter sp. NHP19-012]GMB96808.1 hypothetical protein NHP22001_13970 [Helicobacter sp. NHP22-001]
MRGEIREGTNNKNSQNTYDLFYFTLLTFGNTKVGVQYIDKIQRNYHIVQATHKVELIALFGDNGRVAPATHLAKFALVA